MPAKRCIETKNMCLLFVDYCKMTLVPKEKRENGYRREKMTPVPKRNSSLPQKALRVDIFSKERYNSWKKAPMEESSHGRKIPFAEGHRRQLWIYLNI